MHDVILIDGGEMFEGDWEQLLDCFGLIDEADLIGFCRINDCVYEINEPVYH